MSANIDKVIHAEDVEVARFRVNEDWWQFISEDSCAPGLGKIISVTILTDAEWGEYWEYVDMITNVSRDVEFDAKCRHWLDWNYNPDARKDSDYYQYNLYGAKP